MKWILCISIFFNVVLIITCVVLKESRDWYEKSWWELARTITKAKRGWQVMTSKGITAVIAVSCVIGNCLAILVRSLWKEG